MNPVNIFSTPFKIDQNDPNNVIDNHVEAAQYALTQGISGTARLQNHTRASIKDSPEFAALRSKMPSSIPAALKKYKNNYKKADLIATNAEIVSNGVAIPEGQYLYHAGHWESTEDSFSTDRPFSTSFCPVAAYLNGLYSGKPVKNPRLDLMVIRVAGPDVIGYIYPSTGKLAHESEVVFASGATLTRIREEYIHDLEFPILGKPPIHITLHLLEVEIR